MSSDQSGGDSSEYMREQTRSHNEFVDRLKADIEFEPLRDFIERLKEPDMPADDLDNLPELDDDDRKAIDSIPKNMVARLWAATEAGDDRSADEIMADPKYAHASPMSGEWRYEDGALWCGKIRIAKQDMRCGFSGEIADSVFGWIVHSLNAAKRAGKWTADDVSDMQVAAIEEHAEGALSSMNHYIAEICNIMSVPPVKLGSWEAPDISQEQLNAIEDLVGMAPAAWDCVDPREIVAAACNVVTHPPSGHDARMERANKLRNAVNAIRDLMAHSEGVTGLHRNGDVATWEELLDGWLSELKEVDGDSAAKDGGVS